MKLGTALLVFGTLLHLLLGPACAEDDFTRPGWYAGVGGTFAVHLFEDIVEEELEEAVPGDGDVGDVDHAAGINARFGRRFRSWLAAEVQYEWVSGFDVSARELGKIFSLEGHTWTLNGKLLYPIKRFHPYFLGGMGVTVYKLKDRSGIGLNFQRDDLAFAGRVGFGGDVYLTNNWVANLEVTGVLTTNDINDPAGEEAFSALHYLSTQFGIQYRF